MRTLSLILIGLYAALNLLLACAEMLSSESPAPKQTRIIPCLTFLLAGIMLGTAVISRSTSLVMGGLLIASLAPYLYGQLVEHSNVLIHHAVRAVIAIGLALLWVAAHSQE